MESIWILCGMGKRTEYVWKFFLKTHLESMWKDFIWITLGFNLDLIWNGICLEFIWKIYLETEWNSLGTGKRLDYTRKI